MEKLEKEFPQVTKVTAKRKNGVRYNSDRGFIYTKQKTTKTDTIFSCRNSKKIRGGCTARLRRNLESGLYRRYGNTAHKHPPEFEEQRQLAAVNAVTQEASTSQETARTVLNRISKEYDVQLVFNAAIRRRIQRFKRRLQEKDSSMDVIDDVEEKRLDFLLQDPLLLQDLLSREKSISPDNLEIDWELDPERPIVQTVSLNRFQRSYLASRFHIRIDCENLKAFAVPNTNVSYKIKSSTRALNDLSDTDAIPQVVEECLTIMTEANRFIVLLHHSESCWEMVGCLSPIFIKPEIMDSDDPLPPTSPRMDPLFISPDSDHISSIIDDTSEEATSSSNGDEAPIPTPCFDLVTSVRNKHFYCTICNKKVPSKNTLYKHMKQHDPSKKVKCPSKTCPYETTRNDHMDRHITTRHPELLIAAKKGPGYNCPKCLKNFPLKFYYERHHFKCSEPTVETFPCPSCDFVATRRRNLTTHKRMKHLNSEFVAAGRTQ